MFPHNFSFDLSQLLINFLQLLIVVVEILFQFEKTSFQLKLLEHRLVRQLLFIHLSDSSVILSIKAVMLMSKVIIRILC